MYRWTVFIHIDCPSLKFNIGVLCIHSSLYILPVRRLAFKTLQWDIFPSHGRCLHTHSSSYMVYNTHTCTPYRYRRLQNVCNKAVFTFHIWKVGCWIIKAVLLVLQPHYHFKVEGPFLQTFCNLLYTLVSDVTSLVYNK